MLLKITVRAALVAALISELSGAACTVSPSTNDVIRIGAPEGAGLILAEYAAEKLNIRAEVTPVSRVTGFFDCCSSATKWALSSGSLDAAILCPDEARTLVESDGRYIIIGPCMANALILVVKDPSQVNKIGIAQNRQYEKDMIDNMFGDDSQTRAMLPQSLPTAYERGLVDGVVVDVEQAFRMKGTKLPAPNTVSYVLVIRKDAPDLDRVVSAFSAAAVELNDVSNLERALAEYGAYPEEREAAGQWLQLGVKFLTANQGTMLADQAIAESSDARE